MTGRWLTVVAVALAALGCGGGGHSTSPSPEASPSLTVSSGAFAPMGAIPVRYTCDGDNVSPPLAWSGAPGGTASFALVMDDPDAPRGTFVHWVLYNLPAGVQSLPEGVPTVERLESGALQGRNSAGRLGYTGPCPPRGPAHRYRFSVYALDATLPLAPGVSQSELEKAMAGHILARGQLVGTYSRESGPMG
ncbi:Putative lipoprotein LppC [bacterium HR25]|nr:Putative lipoprotein LppC [bacterium HR25]